MYIIPKNMSEIWQFALFVLLYLFKRGDICLPQNRLFLIFLIWTKKKNNASVDLQDGRPRNQ